jgi:hypothetical protein
MPSWPAWVASRIESMKDECQPSGADRRYPTVPTLPSNLTLGPAERAEIERHVLALKVLCEQTPQASADCEAATLVVVTKLMLALPSAQQNDPEPRLAEKPLWLLWRTFQHGPSQLRFVGGSEVNVVRTYTGSRTITDGDQHLLIFAEQRLQKNFEFTGSSNL